MAEPESLTRVIDLGRERLDEPIGQQALLDGLRDGDPMAFEALMDRYEAPLYRFFFYSHGNHELAQDQVAETFGNMVTAIHKMRGEGDSLKAFVYGVGRNVMRRGWRRKKMAQASEAQLAMLADKRPSAYRRAADRQAFDLAMGAIDKLGEPARQIMLLRFVEEMPLGEIAQALEMPVGSVKSHIHRARARLKDMLGDIV